MSDAFESAIEPLGRYGAVFERDNDSSYFYLLDLERPSDLQIIEAFNVDFLDESERNAPPIVVWGSVRRIVGLLLDGRLIAIFDLAAPSPHGRRATNADMIYFGKN